MGPLLVVDSRLRRGAGGGGGKGQQGRRRYASIALRLHRRGPLRPACAAVAGTGTVAVDSKRSAGPQHRAAASTSTPRCRTSPLHQLR